MYAAKATFPQREEQPPSLRPRLQKAFPGIYPGSRTLNNCPTLSIPLSSSTGKCFQQLLPWGEGLYILCFCSSVQIFSIEQLWRVWYPHFQDLCLSSKRFAAVYGNLYLFFPCIAWCSQSLIFSIFINLNFISIKEFPLVSSMSIF